MSVPRYHGIGNWNHLLDWVHKNECILRKGDKDKEETHLLINGALGGRLSVPDDKYEEFLRAVEYAVRHDDAWLYIVERQTRPAFKMLAELDLELWDHALTLEEVVGQVLTPFVRVMDAAYPDMHPRVMVCMAEPKEVERSADNAKVLIKSGIHLIWPEINVDASTAWKLRAWFLHELVSDQQPFEPARGSWETVLDPCVFEKNGLRMIWSRKCGACPECKGRSRQILIDERQERKLRKTMSGPCVEPGGAGTGKAAKQLVKRLDIQSCNTCQNEGKVDLGRPYHTVAVLSTRGGDEDERDMAALRRDTLLDLRTTSVKVIPRLAETDIPRIALDRAIEVQIEPFYKRPSKKAVNACLREVQDLVQPPVGSRKRAATGSPTSALNSVMGDDPAYHVIMAYANKCLTGGRITSIKTDLDRHMFLLNSTCRMCLNKGKDHGTSTVYYIMYPDGIVQKCRSDKPGVYYHECKLVSPATRPDLFRPGVMMPPQLCSEFKSSMIHYPLDQAAAIAKIFPERYVAKFARAPAPRPPSMDADMGMSSSQGCGGASNNGLDDGSSLGDLGMGSNGESNSRLGKLNLLDYNPELRDAPSFAEARRRYLASKQALMGKPLTPPPKDQAQAAPSQAQTQAPQSAAADAAPSQK